jgi:hypothetical protein
MTLVLLLQYDQVHRVVQHLTRNAPVPVPDAKEEVIVLAAEPVKTARAAMQPPGGPSSIQFGNLMVCQYTCFLDCLRPAF